MNRQLLVHLRLFLIEKVRLFDRKLAVGAPTAKLLDIKRLHVLKKLMYPSLEQELFAFKNEAFDQRREHIIAIIGSDFQERPPFQVEQLMTFLDMILEFDQSINIDKKFRKLVIMFIFFQVLNLDDEIYPFIEERINLITKNFENLTTAEREYTQEIKNLIF